MEKLYSSIEIRSLHEERREIEGIASTPAVDRAGDIVDPLGLTFLKETPLLLNHKADQPVGTVVFGLPTQKGLPFKAKIAKVIERGAVKDRCDEAWHSVKSGLIKGVSIGFVPKETKPLGNGGNRFTKADVHELSLTATPCNTEAGITAFKAIGDTMSDTETMDGLENSGLPKEVIARFRQLWAERPLSFAPHATKPIAAASNQSTLQKDSNAMSTSNTSANHFIRAAIAKAVADTGAASGYASTRWGEHSDTARYVKAAVSPATAGQDAADALAVGSISRQQFVQAVFSRSIIGQLQGLVRVPAITRINTENLPTAAAFFGETVGCPVAQGNVGVQLADKRKVGIVSVVSQELLKATDDTAEATISAILQRALSRGLDKAFLGSQVRDSVSPAGLASVATQAASFSAGIQAFTGDLTVASVLVNPLTAVTLRSSTETQITAKGGVYGGLPAIASYAVPTGKLFIVDATRVVAYIGDAEINSFGHADIYGMAGVAASIPVNMFHTAQVALHGVQYADWEIVPGVAVEISLTA